MQALLYLRQFAAGIGWSELGQRASTSPAATAASEPRAPITAGAGASSWDCCCNAMIAAAGGTCSCCCCKATGGPDAAGSTC